MIAQHIIEILIKINFCKVNEKSLASKIPSVLQTTEEVCSKLESNMLRFLLFAALRTTLLYPVLKCVHLVGFDGSVLSKYRLLAIVLSRSNISDMSTLSTFLRFEMEHSLFTKSFTMSGLVSNILIDMFFY